MYTVNMCSVVELINCQLWWAVVFEHEKTGECSNFELQNLINLQHNNGSFDTNIDKMMFCDTFVSSDTLAL